MNIMAFWMCARDGLFDTNFNLPKKETPKLEEADVVQTIEDEAYSPVEEAKAVEIIAVEEEQRIVNASATCHSAGVDVI